MKLTGCLLLTLVVADSTAQKLKPGEPLALPGSAPPKPFCVFNFECVNSFFQVGAPTACPD